MNTINLMIRENVIGLMERTGLDEVRFREMQFK